MKPFVIAHLYPSAMNIYGDLGNVITLTKRLEWRGYRVVVESVEVGQPFDFGKADLIFGGGGQDSGQVRIGPDLLERGPEIRIAVEKGMPALVVCGLYQLFGHEFVTEGGMSIKGIGVFDAQTRASTVRMIGNTVVDSAYGRLVGFENHSGQTTLNPGQAPLGRVVRGYGNNAKKRNEGAMTGNAIGTYLHGPVLPKNPALADFLLSAALRRRGVEGELVALDDTIEHAAARSATSRPQ
jgi:CobQ-like glutamine amidotransferase family enzyme